ncbi:uncharacterized protein LOC120152864 [Hibiscus syriacus]|uniref:uncharacterized protein LOC120152864 n=1 Tax=Hibiscus syriacus TaxID=106335 RepID=UPI001920D9AA|nr:uncharacterized protein LOC120152864 [Hibiscus syriacus]
MEESLVGHSIENEDYDALQLILTPEDSTESFIVLLIEKGGPWSFNSHLLILHGLQEADDPMTVPLVNVDYWVLLLIHDIPLGFMSKRVARLGTFLEYDSLAISLGYKRIMKVRVRIDSRILLKRRKMLLANGSHNYVRFEYENLTLFCFICGRLGHGESFCPVRLYSENQEIAMEWDASLRAPQRRSAPPYGRWLREEEGGQHGGSIFPTRLGEIKPNQSNSSPDNSADQRRKVSNLNDIQERNKQISGDKSSSAVAKSKAPINQLYSTNINHGMLIEVPKNMLTLN